MTKNSRLTRKPIFWISQIIIFFICTFSAIYLYPRAFPIIDLKIQMDRVGALKSAREISTREHWGPEGYRQASSFDVDSETQTFVELSAGGSQAFSEILKSGYYSPYTWRVRHFAEGKTSESELQFTPTGKVYGFHLKIPENEPGRALTSEQALKIAETAATKTWEVSLADFKLIEKSHEERLNHRIDHTFVYERQNAAIGDGKYRLKLVVSGEKLTQVSHFVKIPDAFLRRYTEMRSSNHMISSFASIAMLILYLLGGCIFGLFFLARKHWILWKTPVMWGAIVAIFHFLEQINNLPLLWMNYDTAISSTGFLLRSLLSYLIQTLGEFLLLTVSFMAAESLSRKAFGHHPQLWKVWLTDQASTYAILGRTVGGYLSVGFFFFYVVAIYLVGTHYFGWWSPSDSLFNPNGLATYLPWFTSIANSLHAGFWEESLFRAVPLASAALLGHRFGNRKVWITGAFILQAVVFGAAHANYPTQPSYARAVELILPSFMFGGLYLAFGLLPGIILHFIFDVISFSIPLFAATSPGAWIHQTAIGVVSLIPLWIVLGARLKTGKWLEYQKSDLNLSWTPPLRRPFSPPQELADQNHGPLNQKWARGIWVASAIALLSWCFIVDFKNQTLPLQLNRDQAIVLARKFLKGQGHELSPSWEALAAATAEYDQEEDFIWKEEGPDSYTRLLGTYLIPPVWLVRFVRFDTHVVERAEEYQVFLMKNGEIYRIRHLLPENRSGKSLEQAEAKLLALQGVEKLYSIERAQLKEVSSNSFNLPHRRDWEFIFKDTSISLKKGEARIGLHISGDQVTSSKRFIFIPEDWIRKDKHEKNRFRLISTVSILVIALVALVGMILAIVNWTHRHFNSQIFFATFASLGTLGVLTFLNDLPIRISQLSTEEPKLNQIISILSFGFIQILFSAGAIALLYGNQFQTLTSKKSRADWKSALTVSALGILGTVFLGMISHSLTKTHPTLGSLGGLGSLFPVVASFRTLEHYAILTALISLVAAFSNRITRNWSQNNLLGLTFLLTLGLASTSINASNLMNPLILGIVSGLYLYVVLRYFIGSRFTWIPLFTAPPLILASLKDLRLSSYPGAIPNSLISILIVLTLSFIWTQKFMNRSSPSKT